MLGFLGIGAQKAGTSWLYAQLAAHPRVRFPQGKEVHFWDRRAGRAPEEWLALFGDVTPGVIEGEITPAYALLGEPDIARIRRLCPELRLFYSVRDPIERAWSAALMALERAELQESEVSDQWFIDHFESAGSRARGDYLGTLERWLAHFAEEQLLLIRFEDIEKTPRGVIQQLLRHLFPAEGGDDAWVAERSEAELVRRQRPGTGLPLRASLRPRLEVQYAAAKEAFAAWLERR